MGSSDEVLARVQECLRRDTQERMAARLAIGQKTVSRYLAASRAPAPMRLLARLAADGVDPRWLLLGEAAADPGYAAGVRDTLEGLNRWMARIGDEGRPFDPASLRDRLLGEEAMVRERLAQGGGTASGGAPEATQRRRDSGGG